MYGTMKSYQCKGRCCKNNFPHWNNNWQKHPWGFTCNFMMYLMHPVKYSELWFLVPGNIRNGPVENSGHHLKWPRIWVLLTLRFHKTVKSGFLQLLKNKWPPKNLNRPILSTALYVGLKPCFIMNLNDCIVYNTLKLVKIDRNMQRDKR